MNRRGYTLAELMAAVIIMAIVAGLALPTFGRARERGFASSSQDILLAIYSGEQVFSTQNAGTYRAITEADAPAVWQLIFVDTPNAANFPAAFSVTVDNAAATPTFLARARRKDGGCINQTITIDQTKTLATSGAWSTTNGAC